VFERLVSYIERGEVRPLVSKTYPLKNIAEAQRISWRNGSRANWSSSRRSLNGFSGFKLSASAGTWIEHVVTC